MTCPECRDTGIISRPYIAGVVSTMTACTCDAGRQFAADIAKLRNGLINSLSANGKRVALDRKQTRDLMLVAADRLEAAIARVAELENALDERGKELTAAWHQLGAADLGPLAKAARGMKRIVEEIDGAMNHGTWRDERGMRLKDTPEWVALYNAISDHPAAPAPVVPAEGLDPERLVMAWMSEMEGFATRGERFMDTITDGNDAAPWLHAACQVGIDAALRSAPPVGARVRPWETRPAGPDAMIPATVEVHRGAWAVVIGTNGKPAGWVDTHDVFANQLYRDHIPTTPAALLPAGEGEE